MTDKVVDVIVIGAGTAGLKAYKAATARGADTIVIERGSGGSTCTRCGCMPSKLLIAAARAAHQARQAGRFGIEIGTISVDAAAVWQRVRRERDRFVASVLEEYHSIPADQRVHGGARFDGENSVVVGDRRIEARRGIVIATGARPIVPDGFEDVRHLVHTHETIFDLDALPQSLAVLGAGPLGLELAQAFARLGVDVAVFDPGSTVGGLKDPDCNAAAIDAIGSEVRLHLETKARASAAGGDQAKLGWDGGELVVDCILAATGRAPAMQDLGLEDTGIALDDDGVPVFDRRSHRCGDSRIFVAGDADAWRPVLHEAARGGRIAGEVAAGGEPPRCLPAFSVAFTEPGIAQIGTAFADLPPDARIGKATVADNGRATIDGHTHGLVKLYGDRAGKLIGASIVAPDAEHLGHLVALGIDRDIDVATFADQAWYHPTLGELLQSAARDLAGIED